MTFEECCQECLRNEPLVAEFDRLNKSNLSFKGSPLDLEIDKATGRLTNDVRDFVRFVWNSVWIRLPQTSAAKVE